MNQYGLIPCRHIINNIANVYIGMEYANYDDQDILIMQIDIEKTFDAIEQNLVTQMRFGILTKDDEGTKKFQYYIFLTDT